MQLAQKKKTNTVGTARELALPVLQELGLELWDLRYEKEGSSWYLRYFIDREGGVSIGDCEAFSRRVDKLLDEADPIEGSYILEVSSPGVERELTHDWHFARYEGQLVSVRLIRPVDGVRDFVGELLPKQGDHLAILIDGDTEMRFLKSEAAYVRLYADFESGGLEQ